MNNSIQQDFFGLTRETKIVNSKVRDFFTPHKPIDSLDLFFGRQSEVQRIIEQINTPGQHSLLYGERGVGKSSLANIASDLLFSKLLKGKIYIERCDSSTTFESILKTSLSDVGIDINLRHIESTKQKGGNAKFIIPIVAEGEFGANRETSETRDGPANHISPSFAVNVLHKLKGLLVVDEADALKEDYDKQRLAEFIKLLSDSNASFKVLIVGVAETGEQLIASHASVSRCLRETRLDRMPDNELALVILGGADKINLSFDDIVVKTIVKLSAGYPHFTHLLALKCAEDAVAEGHTVIEKHHLKMAMKRAVDDAEGSLKRMYMKAIRSYSTDMYRIILCAAASLDKTEFSAKELRKAIFEHTKEELSQQSLNNYFK